MRRVSPIAKRIVMIRPPDLLSFIYLFDFFFDWVPHMVNAQQTQNLYKNQRGSVLEIFELDDHKIEGFFTTAVTSKTCRLIAE